MSVLRGRVQIVNRLGMHARAAAEVVKLAADFRSEIVLQRDGKRARASSVLELLMLCGEEGAVLDVEVAGDDAPEALSALGELFAERFGEPN